MASASTCSSSVFDVLSLSDDNNVATVGSTANRDVGGCATGLFVVVFLTLLFSVALSTIFSVDDDGVSPLTNVFSFSSF